MRGPVGFMVCLLAFGPSYAGDAMSTQGESAVPSTQALVLDDQPLTADAVITSREILSEQTLLGPGDERFSVREGRIAVGKPTLYALKPPKLDGGRLVTLRGDKPSTFYLVVFRFTLELEPGERRYGKMHFKVALSDPQATAFQLIPERVVTEEDVKKGYDIGFSISLPGDKSKSPVAVEVDGKATQTIGFVRLIPEITAFGSGKSVFSWQFTGRGDQSLAPGTKTAAAVIQIPADTKRLRAMIACDVDLERTRFERWFKVPTKIEELSVELPLL